MVAFTLHICIWCYCPGIACSCRDDICSSVLWSNREATVGADCIGDICNYRRRIYSNVDSKGISLTVSGVTRSRSDGVGDCLWTRGSIRERLSKVSCSGSGSLPCYVWIVYKSPGVGGSGRDDVSVSVSRGDGKWTIGADGFVNGLDEGFWIYLNADLER